MATALESRRSNEHKVFQKLARRLPGFFLVPKLTSCFNRLVEANYTFALAFGLVKMFAFYFIAVYITVTALYTFRDHPDL